MPIDFTPSWMSAELADWRATCERFVEREMLPADEEARRRGHVGHALWRRAGELGLLCADVPPQWGGGGGDFRHEAVLHEAMSRRALSGMSASVHSIVAHYFLNHGTAAQKAAYLPRLARGERVGAIAMTEPGAGSDLQGLRTRARLDGAHWVIDGAKTFISNGLLAGVVLVVARTDPQAGAKGMSLMIVETAGAEGFRVGRVLDKVGLKAQDTAELFFDAVRVPADAVLGGEPGRGFAQLMSDLPYERLLIASIAVAAMEGAFAETLAYVRERKAFGQAIAEFQNTRFTLAEVAAEIRVARDFVDRCIERQLAGTLDTATASMAKLWTTELQGRVIDRCLQLFGGYGYMNEFPIARRWVDARIQRIYGGSNEIMKEVIARSL